MNPTDEIRYCDPDVECFDCGQCLDCSECLECAVRRNPPGKRIGAWLLLWAIFGMLAAGIVACLGGCVAAKQSDPCFLKLQITIERAEKAEGKP